MCVRVWVCVCEHVYIYIQIYATIHAHKQARTRTHPHARTNRHIHYSTVCYATQKLVSHFLWLLGGIDCGLALVRRIETIIGLFCKKALSKRLYSAK